MLVSTGIFMEHLPPSKHTIARALKTYTFSSVIGLMLNLKFFFIENKSYKMQHSIKKTQKQINIQFPEKAPLKHFDRLYSFKYKIHFTLKSTYI